MGRQVIKKKLPIPQFPEEVTKRYAEYLVNHRIQADGHFFHWWKQNKEMSDDNMEEALCALIYNATEYLQDLLRRKSCE